MNRNIHENKETSIELEAISVELPTGVALQYVEQGDPSGVPVLLLPGGFDSWRAYERVLPHLPESIRAFVLTQRGHGDSSKPTTGYSTGDFAADAAAFMDVLQLDAAVIAGHSSSSLIAHRFARDCPEHTLGLVLVGGFATMRGNPVALEVRDAASKLEDPVDPGFVREFQESMLAQPVPQLFLDTMNREALKVPARTWRALSAAVLEEDTSKELHKIKVPTLLVWGDRDAASPRSEQGVLVEAIAGSRLVVYEGAGHSVHWEDPERFASDLVSFIETVIDREREAT
ncbi:MAG TPA: alpha/beta hydrolase [Rubrobacter sp.]|nr:alpha/beta hydrolase [Rubrobacter sp.]